MEVWRNMDEENAVPSVEGGGHIITELSPLMTNASVFTSRVAANHTMLPGVGRDVHLWFSFLYFISGNCKKYDLKEKKHRAGKK